MRQSLDTVGAFAGPLVAMLLLYGYSSDLRLVMWAAVPPALICVALIVWGVQEPETNRNTSSKMGLQWRAARRLPNRYWQLLSLTALITLARMTDALLVLRAQDNGLVLVLIPMVLVVYSAVYALSAWPVGVLAERLGQRGLLLLGMLCLAGSQCLLAFASTTDSLFWLGIILWGLHMGLTQGLLTSQVAKLAPADLRGTAFGLFHLTTGLMQLLAGVGFGWLWVAFSPQLAFQIAALLSLISLPLIWRAMS